MSDVARVAGVSGTTVSHVINRTRYISPDTEKAVRAAIESTGYLSDSIARSLRTGSTLSVGLSMSALSNPHFGAFVHSMEREIAQAGYSLVLADTHDDPARERRAVEEILSHRVDGMIVAPTADSQPVLEKLARLQVPTLLIDRIPDRELLPGSDAVGVENVGPTAELVGHLAEMGHTRIGFLAPAPGLTTIAERVEGYRRGLDRHGLTFDPDLLVRGDATGRPAQAAVGRLLSLSDPPTGLVVGNNEMLIEAMRELRDRGVRVPEDLALVTFDDFEWADLFHPRLTAMAQPVDEIGRTGVTMLFERMADPDREPRVVRVQPTFRHRDSCGPHG